MNKWVRDLIVYWYGYPYRSIERYGARQYGERKGRWLG